MAKRILVVIEDDWELAGNGKFHVASHQYLPARIQMQCLRDLGIRMTFMVEAAQQLAFLRHSPADADLRLQSRLWRDSVVLMKEWGFDVQLHIHPQWAGATYQNGRFHLDRNWNFATYEPDVRRRLLAESIAYLREILQEVDREHEIHSFKAGAWGLQPSAGLLADLEAAGMELVLGPSKDICIQTPEFHADYTTLEEGTLPYCPDLDDICRVSPGPQGLVVVPLTWWARGSRAAFFQLLGKFTSRKSLTSGALARYVHGKNGGGSGDSPLVAPSSRRLRARLARLCSQRRLVHLTLGNDVPLPLMKHAFDQAVRRLRQRPEETVPLVLETHTKNYWGDWTRVPLFLRYLVDHYGDLFKFQTLTQLRESIHSGRIPLRGGGSSPLFPNRLNWPVCGDGR